MGEEQISLVAALYKALRNTMNTVKSNIEKLKNSKGYEREMISDQIQSGVIWLQETKKLYKSSVDENHDLNSEIQKLINEANDILRKEKDMADKDELIEEAKSYMRTLRLNDNIIDWMERGIITCSRPNNKTSPLDDSEKDVKDEITRLEKEDNLFVYHVIKTISFWGTIYSLLYVNANKKTWENEGRYTIKLKCPLLYAYNRDNDNYSEFGRAKVSFRPCGVGLDRLDLK